MRLYAKKFLRSRINERTEHRKESRDGVVIEIVDNDFIRVSIQGTPKPVLCRLPRSREFVPEWAHAGNPVTIRHTGGVRGRLEVMGDALYIPSPVAGQDDVVPPAQDTNRVLSGMIVDPIEIDGEPTDCVVIYGGTYMIDEVLYQYGDGEGLLMGDEGSLLGSAVPLGSDAVDTICWLEEAGYPSGSNFRYDLLVIDVYGDVSIVMGAPAATVPVMPDPPTGTVQIAFVLLWGGMEGITEQNIGRIWEPRRADSLKITQTNRILRLWTYDTVTYGGGGGGHIYHPLFHYICGGPMEEFYWPDMGHIPCMECVKTSNVTVKIYDQYGKLYTAETPNMQLVIENLEAGLYPNIRQTLGAGDDKTRVRPVAGGAATFSISRVDDCESNYYTTTGMLENYTTGDRNECKFMIYLLKATTMSASPIEQAATILIETCCCKYSCPREAPGGVGLIYRNCDDLYFPHETNPEA